jgi:protein-tyrosine phosphatase
MAAILYSFGFREICCTPHMLRGVYDNSPEKVDSALKELADALQTAGISMRLYSGMEYYLDEFFPLALEAPLPLPGSLILFEAPVQVSPDFLLHSTYRIIRKGFVPLLAHPERCGTLAGASELMEKLAGMGCLFQGNIGSFAGAYGERARKSALSFLEKGLYARLGTDAHNPGRLEKILGEGFRNIEKRVGAKILKDFFEVSKRKEESV